MVRVVLRRLVQLGVTLIALMTLVFVWLRSLPGGPVDALLGERATPETRELLIRASATTSRSGCSTAGSSRTW